MSDISRDKTGSFLDYNSVTGCLIRLPANLQGTVAVSPVRSQFFAHVTTCALMIWIIQLHIIMMIL